MYYIFDMDGTLIDSMPAYCGAMLRFLENHNISYPEDIVKIITPLGISGAAKYFIESLKADISADKIAQEVLQDMYTAYTTTIPAKEHVIETVKKLKESGHSLSVLTASPHMTLDPCLKRLGIYELFDHVWSCEDFGTTKSDVKIYHEAAKRLGTTAENCIFLDDNCNAITTAKKSGMTVYGVYDPSSEEYIEEMKEISHKYIYSFEELI
ncbi:MAG: HAD family phosphatase [Clostridia bacterium]|nr:HAD family phosphatase [Clostridia bacterium]